MTPVLLTILIRCSIDAIGWSRFSYVHCPSFICDRILLLMSWNLELFAEQIWTNCPGTKKCQYMYTREVLLLRYSFVPLSNKQNLIVVVEFVKNVRFAYIIGGDESA